MNFDTNWMNRGDAAVALVMRPKSVLAGFRFGFANVVRFGRLMMSTRKLSALRPGSVTVRMKFIFTCRRFGPLTPSIRNGKTRFWKVAG